MTNIDENHSFIKRFCPRGHDKLIFGVRKGQCRRCKDQLRKENIMKDPIRRMKKNTKHRIYLMKKKGII